MCKVAKFFEGGIEWQSLVSMPVDELFDVIREANEIEKAQQQAIKAARNGK